MQTACPLGFNRRSFSDGDGALPSILEAVLGKCELFDFGLGLLIAFTFAAKAACASDRSKLCSAPSRWQMFVSMLRPSDMNALANRSNVTIPTLMADCFSID